MRRWAAWAAVAAIILGVLAAFSAGETRLEMELSADGVTLSATMERLRVEVEI